MWFRPIILLESINSSLLISNCRSTTPQQWEDFSRYNKERAEAEMGASTRLREAIHHTLHKTENDLEAQRIASEYAFRRRIHEFERAKDELEWQKKNVSEYLCFSIHEEAKVKNTFPCTKFTIRLLLKVEV